MYTITMSEGMLAFIFTEQNIYATMMIVTVDAGMEGAGMVMIVMRDTATVMVIMDHVFMAPAGKTTKEYPASKYKYITFQTHARQEQAA